MADSDTDGLSHLDSEGQLKMVDIHQKRKSYRAASAIAEVHFPRQVFDTIVQTNGVLKKGSIFEVSRIAGIMACKRTAEIIPLCHPISIESCDIHFTRDSSRHMIAIESHVSLHGKTGVEMEALTAVSSAALCLYDMCKALSHDIQIQSIRLAAKTGGKSDFQ